MPIYEYECKKCARQFEHLQKGSKDSPSACPHCGGKNLKKVFSSFSAPSSGAHPAEMPPACAGCPSTGCPHRK